MTVIFHFSLFSTIAAGLFDDSQFCGPHPRDLMMLILIGIFGAGGQIGLTMLSKGPSGGSEYL